MEYRQLRTLADNLTGHCHLKKHMTILEITEDPMCRKYDEEEETYIHFLCRCMMLVSYV